MSNVPRYPGVRFLNENVDKNVLLYERLGKKGVIWGKLHICRHSQLHVIKDLTTHLIAGYAWSSHMMSMSRQKIDLFRKILILSPQLHVEIHFKNVRNVINLFLEPKNEVYTWGK